MINMFVNMNIMLFLRYNAANCTVHYSWAFTLDCTVLDLSSSGLNISFLSVQLLLMLFYSQEVMVVVVLRDFAVIRNVLSTPWNGVRYCWVVPVFLGNVVVHMKRVHLWEGEQVVT